jgi:hypothetical protein
VRNLAGLAVAAVTKHLASPAYRADLLSKLQESKDEDSNPMGKAELTAEALTQLISFKGDDMYAQKLTFCTLKDEPQSPECFLIKQDL